MNYLLDTHTFLWFILDDPRLPEIHKEVIRAIENTIIVSVITTWELTMLVQAGKLDLRSSPVEFVHEARGINAFGYVGLDEVDAAKVATLPIIHGDPFDRILIAQALRHNLTLITKDRKISQYDVPTLAF